MGPAGRPLWRRALSLLHLCTKSSYRVRDRGAPWLGPGCGRSAIGPAGRPGSGPEPSQLRPAPFAASLKLLPACFRQKLVQGVWLAHKCAPTTITHKFSQIFQRVDFIQSKWGCCCITKGNLKGNQIKLSTQTPNPI